MESGSNWFSLPTDNPLKKDECEANLRMFETLATLQVSIFSFKLLLIYSSYSNCSYNMDDIKKLSYLQLICQVVFTVELKEILRLITNFSSAWESSQLLELSCPFKPNKLDTLPNS